MPLTPRQELAYNHRCDLYAPQYTIAADGKRGPITYGAAPAYENVACRIEVKSSPSAGTPVGRLEADLSDAIDRIAFAEDQEIDDSWWVHSRTLRPDGTMSNMTDRWWVVRGEPQRSIDSTRRRGGRKTVMASQESRPPLGLPL